MRKYAVLFVICGLALTIAGIYFFISASSTGNPGSSKKSPEPATAKISESELEKLSSLPYTNWSSSRTDVTKFGVIRHNPKKSFLGINLFNSRNLSQAHLMDMHGKFVHTWSLPKQSGNSWHTIHLLQNGDLFAIVKDDRLIRLSVDSKIRWEYKASVHHDVAVTSSGFIYVPIRRPAMWTTGDSKIPLVKEYIAVLTNDGKLAKEISLSEALSPFLSKVQLEKIQAWASTEDIPARIAKRGVPAATWWENKKPDAFHVNSIQVIERNIPGLANKDDLLLSVRQLDLIAIFRPSTGKLVWSWGQGEIQCQHHATLLENNNILLFDNGCQRKNSRVLEVNPITKKIVWEYKSSLSKEFYSHRRGAAQRLANGNTLITESDRGRVFEVTPGGEIVWEFLNPDVFSEKKRRAVIYRMVRIPEHFLNARLPQKKKVE